MASITKTNDGPLTSIISTLNSLSGQAHWTLRLAIASVFIYHGLTKFPVLNEMAAMMGMPVAMIAVIALIETAAGILVLIGGALNKDILTRLGGLLVIPIMTGAIAMVHWGQWAFTASETHPMGGMEFQVTLILIALYLVIKGNGINQANS